MVAFVKDESGVTAMAYALMAARVAVGLILSLTFLGDGLAANFEEVAPRLASGSGPMPA